MKLTRRWRTRTLALTVGLLAGLAALASIAGSLASVETESSPPASVASVSVTRSDGSLTASWSAPSGATRYHVTYTDNGGASWHAPVANHTNITATSLTFGVDNAKTYLVGVRAGNEQGWSGWRNSAAAGPYTPPTPPPTPPAAVASVSVTRSDGSLTASWDAPSGATSYHITYRSDNGAGWQLAALNHTATSMTITATNSETYVVGVRARNSAGDSGWVNSPAAGPYAPTPPSAPTSVAVTRADGAITASWPAVSGATGYTVSYSAVGDGSWITAASNHAGTSITITGVNNDYTYIVGASANNRAGGSGNTVSPASGPYSQQPPQAPPSVTILRADGQLTAFWNSGYGAESYHVTYSSDYGKSWTLAAERLPVGNGTTEITIKNLNNAKQYTVGVRARNQHGYSGWRNSSPSGPYAPIAAPPKPKNVQLYSGNQTAVFIWERPEWHKPVKPGGAEVTGYQAAYWLNPGVCTWPADIKWYNIIGSNGDTVYHAILGHHIENGQLKPGLKNGTRYGVALRALNQHVPGPAVAGCLTPSVYASPPPLLPPAPQNLNLIRGDGTLTVTWHHARTALGYQVDYSTNGGQSWMMAVWWNNTTSTILRGMDNNVAYTVRVRGRNNRGDGAWSDSVTNTPVSVSNLSETRNGNAFIGNVASSVWVVASGFTTGANSSGYKLQGVTVKMENITGSPTGLTAAIHAASGGNPAASATYTLTGPTSPVANAQNTWSCAGVCSLDKDTEYFLVLTPDDTSTRDNYYGTAVTLSDNETNTPADAGWSIANAVKYSINGGNWFDSGSSYTLKFKVTATLKEPVSLTASNVTSTGATLTLSNWSKDWYYKANEPPHTTCQGPVSGASTTLSGLTSGETYRYYAYSNNTCGLSTILATAPDFTTQ